MPGKKVRVSKYKRQAARENRKEREARIAREKRKARNAKEVKAVVSSRVSYVKKPFAKNSIFSIGLAGAALLLAGAGFVISVRAQGEAGLNVAAFEFCSFLVSLFAIWYGVKSFSEKEKNYILARIGTGLGGALIVLWLIMMIIGMRG